MSSYKSTAIETVELTDRELLGGMRNVVDDWSLAFELGFSGKGFWYILKQRDALYKVYKIPKKSGGKRTIHAPEEPIYKMHNSIRWHILRPLVRALGDHVTAYQSGKSTIDAARQHVEPCAICDPYDVPHTCEYTLVATRVQKSGDCVACTQPPVHLCPRRGVKIHMDLSNFFGSTKKAWVREYFETIVGYNRYVSTLLAGMLTVEFNENDGKWEGVPQGSPCSGDICNLVADWRIDRYLKQYLQDSAWTYTRYADDLYFSHPLNLDATTVGLFLQDVKSIIAQSGYRVNLKKTRIQRPHRQQKLLGVVINQKVNMPRRDYMSLRAITNNVMRTGFAAQMQRAECKTVQELRLWLQSKITYSAQLSPHKAARLRLTLEKAQQLWRAELDHSVELAGSTTASMSPS